MLKIYIAKKIKIVCLLVTMTSIMFDAGAQKLTLKRNLGSTLMGSVRTEVFSPNNRQIAAAYSDGTVRVWDIENTLINREFISKTNTISKISYSPNSELIAISNDEGEIMVYNIENQKIIASYRLPIGYDVDPNIHSFVLFLDNETLLYGGLSNKIYKASITENNSSKIIYKDEGDISYGRLSNDKKTIAIGVGKSIKIIDIATGELITTYFGIENNVHFLQYSGNSETLLYWCVGGEIGFVDIKKNKLRKPLPDIGDGHPIDFISYSTNLQYLTITYLDNPKTHVIWNMNTRTKESILHTEQLVDCNEKIDFTLPLTATSDNNIIQIWQLKLPIIDTLKNIKTNLTTTNIALNFTKKNEAIEAPKMDTTTLKSVAIIQPNKVIADKNNIPLRVNNREIINNRTPQKIKSKKIEITVWDDGVIDGDVISLNFNGTWILLDYELLKDKKTIQVDVSITENNYLLMYAVNEGKNPPNTAVVTIFDGKTERSYNLRSNNKTCDSINLIYTP